MTDNINKTIILTGGGSGGPVTPLLAVSGSLNKKSYNLYWVGTKAGPEVEMVTREGIKYEPIISGKFRRYFSFQNFIDLFKIGIAFWQAFYILNKINPRLVISAGGYVSVPVVWASWFFRIPVLIHQQDVRAGLANKLMAPFAKKITVTFEKSLKDYGAKAIWIGNPVRLKLSDYVIDPRGARQKLGISDDLPIVLVLGGGTGAYAINKLVLGSLSEITKFAHIIHISGRNKGFVLKEKAATYNYHPFEFMHIDGLAKAMGAASLVVSRCGMGTLTEIAYLKKPAILIPMPDSHQEENALIFKEAQAAIVLLQKDLDKDKFISHVKELINDNGKRELLRSRLANIIKPGANEKMLSIIEELVNN